MNFLFRIFVLLGTLFVLLLFAALIAPYFINWDEFTDEFEREATRIVGQRVQVSGETSVRLLPLPYLEFNGLEVGANTDGSPLMTVDQFSVRAELFPFLSGEVRIVEMDMLRPRVDLQVDERGAVAWTSPTEPVVDPEQVNIENLRVSDGAMIVSGLTGGRQLTLDDINATVDAKSLLGPWRVEGTAQIEGAPSELKIQTGTYQEEGSIRLKIEAIRTEKPYKLLLDGPVELKEDVLEWSGNFEITPFTEQRVSEMPEPSDPLPVVSEGLFVATPDLIDIPDYRLEIGPREDPYTITGFGQITVADQIFFRMDATGRQIDLDRIKAAEEVTGPDTLEGRISAVRAILERVPVPLIDGRINMNLPALVAGDTYVRDVSTAIRPRPDGWDLRAFTAKFPGNTTLEAKGRLALREDFGFDGKIVLASRQPSGFASWISGDVDPTFRKLNIFGIEADVSVSERQASFDQMELRMDDAVLRGKMQRIASITKQPAIILKLQGNKVNVENLRAIYSLVQKSDEQDAVGHDLDIEITAETLEAVLGGENVLAKGVDGHVKVRDGAVSVERFNATNFYGAEIESSGRIEDLLSKPNGNMRFALLADDAAPVLNFAKKYLGENPLLNNLLVDRKLTQDTSLIVEVDTTAQEDGARGQVLASGAMGGTDIDMKFAFDGDFQDPDNLPISLIGSLNNNAPSILMQQVGFETMPVAIIGEPAGPMAIDLDLEGLTTGKLDTQISVQLPETSLVAEGEIQSADWKRFDGDLAVTLGSGNIAPYAVVAGVEVPGLSFDQSLPLSLSFDLRRADGTLEVEKLAGQISGNEINGALKLESKEVARPRLSGKLKVDGLDLALITESVFGQTSALAANLVGDLGLDTSTASFGEPLYGGYDADLDISSERISFGDTLQGRNAKLKLVMLDGAADLQDIAFDILGGKYEGGVQLKNTQGTVLATLRFAFIDLDGDQIVDLVQMPEGIKARLSAQGTAEASAKSFEALVAGLSGNGLFELKDVTVAGLQPSGFDDVLLETGAEGYEIVSERIRDLVEEVILSSETKIEQLEAPFSINRGRLRVRNVSHPFPASRLNGDLELGLPDGSLNARLNILFDPGRREAIAGADPQLDIAWTGTLQNPERVLNTSPLEGYLSLRAFEQSQRRVETLEAKVLETQRIQQQIAVAYAREKYLVRNREERIEREGASEGARLNNASRLFLDDLKRREEDELLRQEEERKQEAEERRRREEEEARIQAEVEARLEAERKAREEAEKLEAERQAKLEAEQKAREEADRKEREEAERLARLKSEQEEAERRKRLEAERKAPEEQALPDKVPLDVQNMLREDIIQNLENFLGSGQN